MHLSMSSRRGKGEAGIGRGFAIFQKIDVKFPTPGQNVRSNRTEIPHPRKWFIVVTGTKKIKYPWDSKIIQMLYPWTKAIDQIPTPCSPRSVWHWQVHYMWVTDECVENDSVMIGRICEKIIMKNPTRSRKIKKKIEILSALKAL